MVLLVMLASAGVLAGDADSAGDASSGGLCWLLLVMPVSACGFGSGDFCWFCWKGRLLLALLVMLAVSGALGTACDAGSF